MVKNIKAVFLDRDGVLNHPIVIKNKPYAPTRIKDFRLYPYVTKFCKILKKNNFLLIVVTNQPDFYRKKISLNILKKIHEKLKKKIQFDDIYVSLSSDNKNFFRKPNPGMLIRAKKKYNINLKKSYLIGDRHADIEAAKRAGCKAIFINRNYEELPPSYQIKTVKSFGEAVNFILIK